MGSNTLVVWNQRSGRADEAAEILSALRSESTTTVSIPRSKDEAQQAVDDFCREGGTRVIAAGGDGTMNTVVNALPLGEGVEFGVLPIGTANDWCASLGIPLDLHEAWETLRRGSLHAVDLVEARSRRTRQVFANIATGGNSQRVAEELDPAVKERWGTLCYLRTALPLLTDLQTYRISIDYDGRCRETYDAWNVLVANGRTSAGHRCVAPQADLCDGLLDVVVVEAGTTLDLVDLSARYFFADYCQSDKVIYRQASRVEIDSDPPVDFSLDGDLLEEHPVEFRVLPAAVNAIVGDEFYATAHENGTDERLARHSPRARI